MDSSSIYDFSLFTDTGQPAWSVQRRVKHAVHFQSTTDKYLPYTVVTDNQSDYPVVDFDGALLLE